MIELPSRLLMPLRAVPLALALIVLAANAGWRAQAAHQDPATRAVADNEATPDIEEVRRRLESSDWAAWLPEAEPDLLYIAARVPEGEAAAFAGGDRIGMRSIGEPGERLFVGALRQPAMRQATVSIAVGARKERGVELLGDVRSTSGRFIAPIFRGPEAPKGYELAHELKGEVGVRTLASEAMDGEVTVTVYTPPGHDPEAIRAGRIPRPPVVYFGDGGVISSMAHAIEPLILAGSIPPTVLIGAHTSNAVVRPPHLATRPAPDGGAPSNNPFANDPRAMEYLAPDPEMQGSDPDTHATHTYMFDRHFRYFTQELPAWAGRELGVSDRPAERVITGFSNSAAFVITLAQRCPGQYGGVIANSIAGGRPDDPLAGEAAGTRFMISSGTWEGYFTTNSDAWAAHLEKHGAKVQRLEVVGGHDAAIWELAVVRGLPWILGSGQEAP